MELDDFRVSCIQGYPYEGFVIGCGYAYVENIPSEMAILENSSYIYNPIKVQQIDTGEFYQFNLSSCIRQQNSLTAQFVSFSLSNLANIFSPPPPIFTIINLCLL